MAFPMSSKTISHTTSSESELSGKVTYESKTSKDVYSSTSHIDAKPKAKRNEFHFPLPYRKKRIDGKSK
tara:strand:+ start:1157 stop:1363 length:207 start_codon:yes stop_codon:yes gene_type:complete